MKRMDRCVFCTNMSNLLSFLLNHLYSFIIVRALFVEDKRVTNVVFFPEGGYIDFIDIIYC